MRNPDSEPNLEEDDIPDASELLDFELIAKSQPDKGQGLWLWLVLILILAGGGWAGWMYLQDGAQDQEFASADGVPLIQSPKFDLKEKPSDPGGMKVPDRDKLVYDRMAGEGAVPSDGVERLLPPPEDPIEPPKAEMAPPAPQPAPQPAQQAIPLPASPAQPAPQAPPAAPASEAAKPEAQPKAEAEAQPAPTPAPTATPAPAPKSSFSATAPAGQGYLVQLSAVRTEQAAAGEWDRLVKKHPDVLGALESVIVRADLGAKGIFYRVRAGWFTSRAEAKAVCDELTRRNVGCIIATR